MGMLFARLIALIFMSVCQDQPPVAAQVIPWNSVDGWTMRGYAYDYGFHEVIGGHVWIGWHIGREKWIVFGTTDNPQGWPDEWHAQCGGWLYPTG